jgi:PDZ domain/Aspartyl protease
MHQLIAFACLGLMLPPAGGGQAALKPIAVPFKTLITQHMTVELKINGKGPYRVIFDTGAPVTLISSKVAKESGLVGKSGGFGFSLFGPMQPTKASSLKLGDLEARDAPVMVMDHPTVLAISSVLGPIEGILGFPFFSRYKMTLDYQTKQLTFVPNGYEPKDAIELMMNSMMSQADPEPRRLSAAALWGFKIAKEKDDSEPGVNITEVLSASPAAKAGIEAGDRLLILDDRWTDSVSDCYTAASTAAAGADVVVQIRRNGKEQEIRVRPVKGL